RALVVSDRLRPQTLGRRLPNSVGAARRGIVRTASGSGRNSRRQARFVASGGVAMNNSLARHLVDERGGFFQCSFGGGELVVVDSRPDDFERLATPPTELPVVLAMLQALTMRFERGCVTG